MLIARKLLRSARNYTSLYPSVYFPLMKLRGRRDFLISSRTDIVIEGFPRCGNSFFEAFVVGLNPGARVAHHTHSVAQVTRACESRLPTVILFREPMDASVSLVQHDPAVFTFNSALREYIMFYTAIMKLNFPFVLSSFESTTTRPADVLAALNESTGSKFKHTAEGITSVEVFSILDSNTKQRTGLARDSYSIHRPMEELEARRKLMASLRKRAEVEVLADLRREATAVYAALVERKTL